jgi:TolB-like protein
MTIVAATHGLSPAEVRDQLSRIVASPEFVASRQFTSFLKYIVEETLAGRAERLKERTLAFGALGRGCDFDPRLDSIVRVVAIKLRHALGRYYASDGAFDPVRIEVPKGGYTPVIRRLGASDGTNGDNRIRDPHGRSSEKLRGLRAVVTVTPFHSFTSGPDERFLAEVLAEDLKVRLCQISWLEMVDSPATQSPEFASKSRRSLGSRVRADYVITGTVGRASHGLHLTVHLTEVKTGVLKWADLYELEIDDDRLTQEADVVHRILSGIGDLFDRHIGI